MDPTDDRWQAALEAEVEAAIAKSHERFRIVSQVMLGLSLGSVMVGIGGIFTLRALIRGGLDGGATVVAALVLGVLLMAAGPVVALRLAGLKWWQALVGAPALGVIAYPVFKVFDQLW